MSRDWRDCGVPAHLLARYPIPAIFRRRVSQLAKVAPLGHLGYPVSLWSSEPSRRSSVTRRYESHAIEEKWQAVWEAEGLNSVTEDPARPKKYVLEMFPYPSGDIHMGHVRNYSIGDVVARYSTMRGMNVLHPIGWDAFGPPAENAAIKSQTPPSTWTYANIEKQKSSFRRMGFSYDWDRTVVT